jgi:signal transduction histidine kinase
MRNRIARVAVLSTVVALVLFLIPLMVAVYNLSVADARSQLERDALTAVAHLDSQFSTADRPELSAPTNPHAQLGLYNRAGLLVAGTGPAHADAPVRHVLSGARAASVLDGTLLNVVPVTSAEQTVGVVRASVPLSAVVADDVPVWVLIAVAAAASLLVGVLIARRAARRVASPMEDLARTARALGQGDFEARTGTSGIPEIDTAGEALGDTAARLDALVERERHLSEDASHQLRTPLAGLRALLETSRPTGASPLTIEKALERVQALEDTIDDFLTPQGTVRGQPTDLAEQARSLERRWHGVLAAAGRPLRLDVADQLHAVTTDRAGLQQILDVLVDNAYQHGAGQIVVRVRDNDNAVVFEVEDEGSTIGLDDDIFRRGYSRAGRSGIGLALAQQLADELSGKLLLTARHPHTRFTLILQRTEEPLAEDYSERGKRATNTAPSPPSGRS